MFRKLLKYEWRANARLFWILSLAALGVALLGGGAAWGANHIVELSNSTVATALLVPGMYMLFGFCCLALVGYMAAVEIINLVHFYKNKFTDEGYLTFTLPVKASHIYLSAFVNILLWMLISGAIMVGCFALMLVIGFGDAVRELLQDYSFRYIWDGMMEIFAGLQEEMQATEGFGLYNVLLHITAVISPLYTIAMAMGCLTLGSVLAKKHKVLASIGVYYVLNMAISTISSSVSGIMTLSAVESGDFFVIYNVTYFCQVLVMIGVIIGSYFLSTHLMQHKLNLP